MGFVSAGFKTVMQRVNQKLYYHDMKIAQTKAYNSTCKKSQGRFNPNWHSEYQKQLSINQQKAKDRKELRSTFIGSC